MKNLFETVNENTKIDVSSSGLLAYYHHPVLENHYVSFRVTHMSADRVESAFVDDTLTTEQKTRRGFFSGLYSVCLPEDAENFFEKFGGMSAVEDNFICVMPESSLLSEGVFLGGLDQFNP